MPPPRVAAVGIHLGHWVDKGLLRFRCVRPSCLGLEAHLAAMQDLVSDFNPDVVVMDPISDLLQSNHGDAVYEMLTRQVDYLKSRGVTAVFTSLNTMGDADHSEQLIGFAHRHMADPKLPTGRVGHHPGSPPVRAQVARHGSFP